METFPSEGGELIHVNTVVKGEEEETYVRGDQQSMEKGGKMKIKEEEEETYIMSDQQSMEEGDMMRKIKEEEEERYVRSDQQSVEEGVIMRTIKEEDTLTEDRTGQSPGIRNLSDSPRLSNPEGPAGGSFPCSTCGKCFNSNKENAIESGGSADKETQEGKKRKRKSVGDCTSAKNGTSAKQNDPYDSEDSDAETTSVRKRKKAFSYEELQILTRMVSNNFEELFGKSTGKTSMAKKKAMWKDIRDNINNVGVAYREIEDLKKRWYDCRNRYKDKMSSLNREFKTTGGGGGGGGGAGNTFPFDSTDIYVASTFSNEQIVGVSNSDMHQISQDFQTTNSAAKIVNTMPSEVNEHLEDTEEIESGSSTLFSAHKAKPGPKPTDFMEYIRRSEICFQRLFEAQTKIAENINVGVEKFGQFLEKFTTFSEKMCESMQNIHKNLNSVTEVNTSRTQQNENDTK
ncbi:uncharacterized protein [Hyperolius riggenbachi]|uniref:uncharacterized protein n=1 Tax=Hyperolius riggenbachi TaxID=752182 RepID=UPI0035A39FFE